MRLDCYCRRNVDGLGWGRQVRSVQARALRRLGIEPPECVDLDDFVSRR
ncbi:hypothetical protein [Paractinoplanes ferrugineus]|nr:hypothetical protein [Actinoplanes ferrugineus]